MCDTKTQFLDSQQPVDGDEETDVLSGQPHGCQDQQHSDQASTGNTGRSHTGQGRCHTGGREGREVEGGETRMEWRGMEGERGRHRGRDRNQVILQFLFQSLNKTKKQRHQFFIPLSNLCVATTAKNNCSVALSLFVGINKQSMSQMKQSLFTLYTEINRDPMPFPIHYWSTVHY